MYKMGAIAIISITKVSKKLAHKTLAWVNKTTPTGVLKKGVIESIRYEKRKSHWLGSKPVTLV
jgi:hypothetical protein